MNYLGEEIKLLKRVVYKNKSQHRRVKYFQSLRMAVRHLSHLHKALLLIESLKKECLEMLISSESISDINFITFSSTLTSLVSIANTSVQSSKHCIYSAEKLSALSAKGWFLPFALTSLSSCCKVESLCQSDFGALKDFQTISTLGLRRVRILGMKNQSSESAMSLLSNMSNLIATLQGRVTLETMSRYDKINQSEIDLGSAIPRSGNKKARIIV